MPEFRLTQQQKELIKQRAHYHPRQNIWDEHFTWTKDGTQILGLISIGRATIDRLQLNREGVVNL